MGQGRNLTSAKGKLETKFTLQGGKSGEGLNTRIRPYKEHDLGQQND